MARKLTADEKTKPPIEVRVHDKDGSEKMVDVANFNTIETVRSETVIPEGITDAGAAESAGALLTRHIAENVNASLVDAEGVRLLGTDGWRLYSRSDGKMTKVVDWRGGRRRFLCTFAEYQKATN